MNPPKPTLLATTAGLLLPAGGSEENTATGDHEKIQGTWKVVSKGKEQHIIPINETTMGSKVIYKLNSNKNPKEIDMEHRRPRGRPRASAKGIYTLDGDTLKICWVYEGSRPTSFPTKSESGQHLLVLKRVK